MLIDNNSLILLQPVKKTACKRKPAEKKSSKGDSKKSSDESKDEAIEKVGPKQKAETEKVESKKVRKIVQPRIDEFVGKRKQAKKPSKNIETDDDDDEDDGGRRWNLIEFF